MRKKSFLLFFERPPLIFLFSQRQLQPDQSGFERAGKKRKICPTLFFLFPFPEVNANCNKINPVYNARKNGHFSTIPVRFGFKFCAFMPFLMVDEITSE
jgi:hypothetical protein